MTTKSSESSIEGSGQAGKKSGNVGSTREAEAALYSLVVSLSRFSLPTSFASIAIAVRAFPTSDISWTKKCGRALGLPTATTDVKHRANTLRASDILGLTLIIRQLFVNSLISYIILR